MNDLYTRDRMNRNNADVEGSGIGSGRYDSREEQKAKISDAKLPVVILFFMAIGLAGIIYMHVNELKHIINGTPVTLDYVSGQRSATWKAPDGNTYGYECDWARVKDGKVTIYYLGTDYRNAVVVSSIQSWLMFYGFFVAVIGAIIFWIYKIFHKKKHAVNRN